MYASYECDSLFMYDNGSMSNGLWKYYMLMICFLVGTVYLAWWYIWYMNGWYGLGGSYSHSFHTYTQRTHGKSTEKNTKQVLIEKIGSNY
jgi:hypothetical protein